MIDQEQVAVVVWQAAFAAACLASLATFLVYRWRARLIQRTGMALLSVTVSILALAGVFLAVSAFAFFLVQWRVNASDSPGNMSLFQIWVDPGITQRFLPLLAIALTWLALWLSGGVKGRSN